MTEEMKNRLEGVMERFLKNAPIDDICPMADRTIRPKWKCGTNDRGNEQCCKSVTGYSKCPHYVKWFYWNLWRLVAKEMARLELDEKQKKKEAKKKL